MNWKGITRFWYRFMEIKMDFKILSITDSKDGYWSSVVDDMSDTVHVYDVKDENGEYLHFESDAYHLESWCGEHKLNYKEQDSSYTIDV